MWFWISWVAGEWVNYGYPEIQLGSQSPSGFKKSDERKRTSILFAGFWPSLAPEFAMLSMLAEPAAHVAFAQNIARRRGHPQR
jgi:hypothetical protein